MIRAPNGEKICRPGHNIECRDWEELEEFKPSVEKTIESMNLFKKWKGKAKGKGREAERARQF